MRTNVLVLLCMLTLVGAQAQNKKERKKNNIQSITEWETALENGKPSTRKTSYREFNRLGLCTLNIEYNSQGIEVLRQTTRYDKFNNKLEEIEFDSETKKYKHQISKFNAFNDKTEETELNPSGVVLKKTVMIYDASGAKVKEMIYNGTGTLIRTNHFTYNSKKLKTGKKSLSAGNAMESEKKWDYVYY